MWRRELLTDVSKNLTFGESGWSTVGWHDCV